MRVASGFGEYYITALNVPPQYYLRRGFAVLFGKLYKQRISYKIFISVSERIPSLDCDTAFNQKLFEFFLTVLRVQFYLIDRRFHFCDI